MLCESGVGGGTGTCNSFFLKIEDKLNRLGDVLHFGR